MLSIPFLSNYIEKVVTKQLLADNVDTLNYYVTSLLLAFFSFAISCKQYFGTPIQCWVPNEFKGGWEKYTEDYCFISNSYHVPFEQHIEDHHRGDHLSYYRWVPIVLALQAVFFFLPNYLWVLMANNCAFNPKHYVEEATKLKTMSGAERNKELDSLAVQFMDGVACFGESQYGSRSLFARSGWNCTYLYLITKGLYVVNVVGQMIMLNSFLGGTYWSWGADTVGDIVAGREWQEAEVFPRVIMCDFKVRMLAQTVQYTVQCVIMMNMINEKLYLFIYIWFLFLIALTLANFFYYLLTLTIPSLRSRLVFFNIDKKRLSRRQLNEFTLECLHPDGVLLLMFIREHVGGRVATELMHKLMEKHTANGSVSSRSTDGDHCTMESLEKKPFLRGAMPLTHFDRYDPPPKNHQLAKYPNLSSPNPNHTMESAPPADEFDRFTTMRMDDRSILPPRPSPRNNMMNGLDQTDLPTARNSSPTDV